MSPQSIVKVAIKRLAHGANLALPFYATPGSAGLDLSAAIAIPMILEPRQRALVPTGFSLSLPIGYEAQVRGRSGLALKYGLTVLNSPGTIDSDYRDELKVMLINHGNEPVIIEPGQRIGQLIITSVSQAILVEVETFQDNINRGGGFGSTGH